jgi:hypothetical protein
MRCHGITKDPETNDLMLVMNYASEDLYNNLQKHFTDLTWRNKLNNLWQIINGYIF